MSPTTDVVAAPQHQQNIGRIQQIILSIVFRRPTNPLNSVLLGLVGTLLHLNALLHAFLFAAGTPPFWIHPSWRLSSVAHQSRFWLKNLLVAGLILFIVLQIPPIVHQAWTEQAGKVATNMRVNGIPSEDVPHDRRSTEHVIAPKQGPATIDLVKPATIEEHCRACGPRAAAAPWNAGRSASTCDLYAVLGLDTPQPSTQQSFQWEYTKKQIHSAAARQLDILEQNNRQSRAGRRGESLEDVALEDFNQKQDIKRLAAIVFRARRILEDPSMRAIYGTEVLSKIPSSGSIEVICGCAE